ncbi:MAG: CRISPR-associated protein Cas4 [Anaerolineae bacterium]|nr:CRISPR-associated protein Cas4 [Anaerolineae bacterium]
MVVGPLICLLVVLAIALLVLARRARRRSGLPQGRVIYTDTRGWRRPEKPLFSRTFLLAGRPDYLVADGDIIIPVEVKSGRAPAQPYRSHLLQLAAYCLLVEETYAKRPPYGIITYADQAFEVDYTPELESALLNTLEHMRSDLGRDNIPRSHNHPARCQACGFHDRCDQSLA